MARGLETDIGLRLQCIFNDLVFELVPLSLGPNDDWMSFISQQNASLVLDLTCSHEESALDHELKVQEKLVSALTGSSIPLIQLSSYKVYGENYLTSSPDETEFPNPEDQLGKLLVDLEQCTARLEKHINLRLSWMLDGKDSLLEYLGPKCIEGQLEVSSDHKFGRPLTVNYVASVITALVQQTIFGAQNWGIYHLHSSDLCSEAEFCDHLCRTLSTELDKDFLMPEVAAKGDERSLLKGSANIQGRRITDDFGIQFPSWRSGFRKLVSAWLIEKGHIEKQHAGKQKAS